MTNETTVGRKLTNAKDGEEIRFAGIAMTARKEAGQPKFFWDGFAAFSYQEAKFRFVHALDRLDAAAPIEDAPVQTGDAHSDADAREAHRQRAIYRRMTETRPGESLTIGELTGTRRTGGVWKFDNIETVKRDGDARIAFSQAAWFQEELQPADVSRDQVAGVVAYQVELKYRNAELTGADPRLSYDQVRGCYDSALDTYLTGCSMLRGLGFPDDVYRSILKRAEAKGREDARKTLRFQGVEPVAVA